MSTSGVYLAVFLGSPTSARRQAWQGMSGDERLASEREGIAAWQSWAERHRDAIVYDGGPLGQTKRASQNGVTDAVNELAAFVVVRASSHEAAAKMFEGHPHFTIFPGDAVEIMPVLPIPGG